MVETLWLTDTVRRGRPTVLDEVRQGLGVVETGLMDVVRTGAVGHQPLEHTNQRALTQFADAARRHLDLAAATHEDPRFVERALDLLHPFEVASGVIAECVAQLVDVDVFQRCVGTVHLQRALQVIELGKPLDRFEAFRQAELLVNAIQEAITQTSRPEFRVVDFSAQDDHVHLIIEAQDAEALSRGAAVCLAWLKNT